MTGDGATATALGALVLLMVFGATPVGWAQPATQPGVPMDVQDHMRKRVDDGGTMGIAVAVVDAAGPRFFCYGVRERGGPPLDPDTVFEIGSITKAFTGLLLADAVQSGKLRLEEAAAKYLPADVKLPSKDDAAITLEHLGTHRSGLPRMPDNFAPRDPENPYADYTAAQLYEFLGQCTLGRAPGAQYEYSNLAAGLLGHLLALQAACSYDELVQSRICRPLSMAHTACRLSPAMQARLARGHANGKPVANWDLDVLAGAGGLRSTPRDMARFLAACLGAGPAEFQAGLRQALAVRYPTGMADVEIALGWHISRKQGAEIVWHNGGTGGYHSFCGWRTDRPWAVVVLANSNDDIDDIGLHVLAPQLPLKPVQAAVTLAPDVLDEYVGYYAFAPGRLLRVTREGEGLQVQLTGQSALPVFAAARDRFFLRVVDAQLTFEREDGKITRVILHQNGRDQAATRVPPDQEPKPRVAVDVEPQALADYVGRYQLAPQAVFDIRVEAGQLTAQLTGQPRFPIFAEATDRFFYKVVDAQLTFGRDAAGKVDRVTLHQNGLDQVARRIE